MNSRDAFSRKHRLSTSTIHQVTPRPLSPISKDGSRDHFLSLFFIVEDPTEALDFFFFLGLSHSWNVSQLMTLN